MSSASCKPATAVAAVPAQPPPPPRAMARLLPAAWRGATLGDAVAGATVALTSLPQYIAYAELAGLSGMHGLRTSGQPLIAFALLTGSPELSIGVTSITAIMAHSSLQGADFRAAHGDEAWMNLLGAFSVLVGLASVLLAASKATALVKFIPKCVISGWKLGFAMVVVSSQAAGALFRTGEQFLTVQCLLPTLALPGAAAVPLSGGAARLYRLGWMVCQPWLWDFDTALLSFAALALVLRGRPVLRQLLRAVTSGKLKELIAGLEIMAATVLVTVLAVVMDYRGGKVGKPPGGGGASDSLGDILAAATVGWVRQSPAQMPWGVLAGHFGGWFWAISSAFLFAAVNFLAIVSVVDQGSLEREMVGQGVGCVISGMAGSAPVGGSLSKSLVAKMAGASSPLAGFVNGLVTVALAAPSVAQWLAPIPKAALAAIVLAAVLPTVLHPRDVLRLRGREGLVAWTTAWASAATDPTKGFLLGLATYVLLHPQRLLLRRRAALDKAGGSPKLE